MQSSELVPVGSRKEDQIFLQDYCASSCLWRGQGNKQAIGRTKDNGDSEGECE